jgi:NADH-quinone oxidoreductase subunit J
MSPQDIAFYICSALTLLCGLVVITKKDPVTSALFLVLCIVSLAGLFLLLHAFFLAAVQVLVYAGAVMVLFLFVIMLLDLKQEARRRINAVRALLGVLSVAAVAALVLRAIWKNNPGAGFPGSDLVGGTAPLGNLLFHNFILPFEILSLLLLVAMVGAILLSKKDLK